MGGIISFSLLMEPSRTRERSFLYDYDCMCLRTHTTNQVEKAVSGSRCALVSG